MRNYASISVALVILVLVALLPPPTVGVGEVWPAPEPEPYSEPEPEPEALPEDLCSEMEGHCQAPDDSCSGMNINNKTLGTKKYCKPFDNRYACCAPSGKVYTADIENSISYALRMIQPNLLSTTHIAHFNSTSSGAFKGFIRIIQKYIKKDQNIIQNHTITFINQLHTKLETKKKTFTAKWLIDQLSDIQNGPPSDGFINGEWQPSVSCHNIDEGSCFWRYMCGLWNIFHTLTVSADNAKAVDPLEVLEGIHGYVVHFLGCDVCAPHFGHMYNQTIDTYNNIVNTTDKAILWLWCAHNSVNNRHTLQKMHTDSRWPPHPQFPPHHACPECWTDNGRPGDYTNCAELFCHGNYGDGVCFAAPGDPFLPYYPFSMYYVLGYLKKMYDGNYPFLNTNKDWQPLIFNAKAGCPSYSL